MSEQFEFKEWNNIPNRWPTFVAMLLSGFVTALSLSYVTEPITVLASCFGVTAAFCGLCFSGSAAFDSKSDESNYLKMSGLLLIQSLFSLLASILTILLMQLSAHFIPIDTIGSLVQVLSWVALWLFLFHAFGASFMALLHCRGVVERTLGKYVEAMASLKRRDAEVANEGDQQEQAVNAAEAPVAT